MKLITANLLNRFWKNGIKPIKTAIDNHTSAKASASVLGNVKLTDSAAVTDSTGLALPATEKNASVKGTLANQISVLNTDLIKKINREDVNNMLSGYMQKGLFNLGSSCSRLDTNCEQVNGCWCYVITLGLWDDTGLIQGVRLAISYQREMPKQWVSAYIDRQLSRPWTEI